MSARWIWWEVIALALALVLVEMGFILLELRTAIVQDWFITLAPLLWLNAAILVLYVFLRQLAVRGGTATEQAEARGGRGVRFLTPHFGTIRQALRPPSMKAALLLVAVGYALSYAFLQGILVLAPSVLGPFGPLVLESPLGYGPALVWAPTQGFGMLLRPYTVAAAVALAVLSGVVVVLFMQVARRDRRALTSLTGPLAGLAVLCPACFATPAAGLVAAYLAPAVTLVGLGTGAAFAFSLGLATALLLVSLLLLWATAAWLSRLLPSPSRVGSNGSGR
ncbi:MAG: hypothetical protein ACE5JE_06785 [Thermoplasmata archaeon]